MNRVRELLQMLPCEEVRDSCQQANIIRNALADQFFLEKQTGIVCWTTLEYFFNPCDNHTDNNNS